LKSILSDLCSNYEDARRDIMLRIQGNPDMTDAGKDIILEQIEDAFYTRDGFIDYHAVFDVVNRLGKIKETVLSTPPDIRSSLLKALAKEGLDAIESCDDSSGQMGEFIIECLTDLGKSIHEQSLSFDENKIIILENLDLLDEEGYGLGDGYINLVLEIPSTKGDFAFLIDELKSRMDRQKESYDRDMYKDMLTEVYKRAGEDNEYLAMLEENAKEEGDCLPLVRFWQEKGDLKRAIGIAEEGIKRAGRWGPDVDLFRFLEEIYRTQNNKEDLLRILIQYFNKVPSLIKYKEIKIIAEELHNWDSVRPGLLGASSGQELIKIYLFEKEHDNAFQMVMDTKERFSDRLRDQVASAIMKEHPDKALKIYFPIVQEFIGMSKRDCYRVAALYAKKVKEIYLQLDREEIWKDYIARIRAENKRRPALIQEFRRL
ncbi:MAG: hypothetical protein Q7J68_03570, partial [Thermoplasmata archaeon]|nr:hypothetical protein [Thermoplasmata archaeon]